MSDIAVVDQPNLRQVAARLAARAEIRDVRLFATEGGLDRMPSPGATMTYNLETDAEVQYEPGDTSFAVVVTYRLTVADVGTDSAPSEEVPAEDRTVAHLSFKMGALFALQMRDNDDPLSEQELEAYAATTGQFSLYPYAREYIYDVTGRLSLPPLTVGVLRMDLPKP